MTRIERWTWNAERGKFTSAGEAIGVDTAALEPATKRLRAADGRFLKGPIPWSWITCAAAQPGQALLVGLCIWRLTGAKKNHTVFLGNSDLKPLGIDRAAKSRALRALERVGLIEITRHPGRFPMVTLLCTGQSRKLEAVRDPFQGQSPIQAKCTNTPPLRGRGAQAAPPRAG